MRMMPRAAPCQCVRRTTVESNMKASIIYTLLVKTLHNVLSSFEICLVLFCPLGFGFFCHIRKYGPEKDI